MRNRQETLRRINKFFAGRKPTPKQERDLIKKLTKHQRAALVEGIRSLSELLNENKNILVIPRGSKKAVPMKGHGKRPRAVSILKSADDPDCANCPQTNGGWALANCEERDDGGLNCYYLPPRFIAWVYMFGLGLF